MIKYKNCKKNQVTMENLYTSRTNSNPHTIRVVYKNNPHCFNLVLDARDNEPDCKISSFGANLYFRTKKGIDKERYKNLVTLAKGIERVSLKYGLELAWLEISKGEPATI